MKEGDKFKFNIELMLKNSVSIDGRNKDEIYTVIDVCNYRDLGKIIGYNDSNANYCQINEVWLIPV